MASASRFLDRLGSAAVPAGLTLASTLIPGGPGLGSLIFPAIGAGLGGLGRREEEERMKKAMAAAKQSAAMANLINALNPRAGAQPTGTQVPSAGLLENLAKAGQTGAQMADFARQLGQQQQDRTEAAKDREQMRRLRDMQLGEMQSDALQRTGAQAAQLAAQRGQQTPLIQATTTGSYNTRRPVGTTETMLLPQTAPPLEVLSGAATEKERLGQLAAADQLLKDKLKLLQDDAALQRELLEAKKTANALALKADIREANDAFKLDQSKRIAAIPTVKRLEELDASLKPMLEQIADIESGKVPFEGINGLTFVKSYIRVYDNAQVSEGDLATIQSQAQSALQNFTLKLRRLADANTPVIVDESMVGDMKASLTSLNEAVRKGSLIKIQAYGDGLRAQALENIADTTIDDIINGAIQTHGLMELTVPEIQAPPPEFGGTLPAGIVNVNEALILKRSNRNMGVLEQLAALPKPPKSQFRYFGTVR